VPGPSSTGRSSGCPVMYSGTLTVRMVRSSQVLLDGGARGVIGGSDTERVTKRPDFSAEYFDQWYANMAGPGPVDEIAQRHLGLPASLLSTSLLTWDGIADVAEALRLPVSGTLLDMACGRGGYGLEIAARTGATLIGVDHSAEAIRQAVDNARASGAAAQFRVGDLAATGLPSGSVEAVVCVDAIQFATHPAAAYAEMRRVLAPGGRVVLTCWEPLDRSDARLPDRLRATDTRQGLLDAGFVEVEVLDRPAWRSAERGMWEEAAALDPGADPALQSFHDEGVSSLDRFDLLRRVLATGTAR
jgi:SAM-dependent methyltransferase